MTIDYSTLRLNDDLPFLTADWRLMIDAEAKVCQALMYFYVERQRRRGLPVFMSEFFSGFQISRADGTRQLYATCWTYGPEDQERITAWIADYAQTHRSEEHTSELQS